jgi:hypothetical protein
MSVHLDLRFLFVILLTLLLTTGTSVGQTITLADVPTATDNDRFFSDRFSVVHPSLSANGFDSVNHLPKSEASVRAPIVRSEIR